MEIEEALEAITRDISPIREEVMTGLAEAGGHVLSRDIIAGAPVPSFARSAMDGYAVLSGETEKASRKEPVVLEVKEEISAGDWSESRYIPHTAIRVMTGAMIPEGYDAVVMQEDTDCGEEKVRIYSPAGRYRNYCHPGEEIKQGETVLKEGQRIGRTEAGLLAAVGCFEVPVRRPARAAVISTGSELADAGKVLRPGQIYNSIRYILQASIKQEGLEISFDETIPDDKAVIREAILKAVSMSDVVITTGGVSVGKKDLIPGVLEELGAKTLFCRVNIQPGTPTIGSILDGRVILSLSGNPYAAIANFDLYFWPVISKLMGNGSYTPEVKEAVLSEPYDKVNRMRRLVRAGEKDGRVFLPVSEHMSSVFGNISKCNCYMDVPAGKRIAAGETVKIRRMKESH